MDHFYKTTHLSEILEKSNNERVIIFIYSSECGSSDRLSKKLVEKITENKLKIPIYKVTVQTEPVLSEKISQWFHVKHESPQIFVIENGTVVYTAHHNSIKIEDFI